MIKIRGISKRFGSKVVLKNLDLDIAKGETLVIVGRSGIGKSVLLKHIIGIVKPDSGTIIVDNKPISELEGASLFDAVRNMGMLFQGGALFDSLTIGENIAFYLRQHGDPTTRAAYKEDEIERRVYEALDMVDLERDVHTKIPSDLSGGMKKRAALARLIVYRPSLLLYDEPTTGLDPITAMQINKLIVRIQETLGATSIVVTHDIHSALYVSDRIALQNEGRICYISKTDEFFKCEDETVQFMQRLLNEDPRAFRENSNP